MDKEVKKILGGFLKPKQISVLEDKLREANCIIYKSTLPKITEQAVMHVDATPDEDYPLRILQAYRQHCDCQWAESTDGEEPTNPLLIAMNEMNEARAKILDKAIAKLVKEV